MPDSAMPMPPGGPGGAPGGPPAVPPGPTAPATVAPDQQGMRMRGRVAMALSIKALEGAVPLLGAATEEGQAVLKALTLLSKHFGSASGDLQKQEVKLLGERAGGVNTPTPQNAQAFQQMIRQRLGGMGVGGGAPSESAAPAA